MIIMVHSFSTNHWEARIAELHQDVNRFLKDPEELGYVDSYSLGERFAAFQAFFSSEARSRDISEWLERYPELRARMVELGK
jgi:hypothetical protein